MSRLVSRLVQGTRDGQPPLCSGARDPESPAPQSILLLQMWHIRHLWGRGKKLNLHRLVLLGLDARACVAEKNWAASCSRCQTNKQACPLAHAIRNEESRTTHPKLHIKNVRRPSPNPRGYGRPRQDPQAFGHAQEWYVCRPLLSSSLTHKALTCWHRQTVARTKESFPPYKRADVLRKKNKGEGCYGPDEGKGEGDEGRERRGKKGEHENFRLYRVVG